MTTRIMAVLAVGCAFSWLCVSCGKGDPPAGPSGSPAATSADSADAGIDSLDAKMAAQKALKDAAYHNEASLRDALADTVAMDGLAGSPMADLDGAAAAEELLSLPKMPDPENVDVTITGATTIGDVAEVEAYVLYKPLSEAQGEPELGGAIRPAALPVRLEFQSSDGQLKITKVSFEETDELRDELPDEVWKLAELVSDFQEKNGKLPDKPGDLLTFWATEHASLKLGKHGVLTYDPVEGRTEARFDFEF